MNSENELTHSYQNYMFQGISDQSIDKKSRKVKSQIEGRFYKCQQCSKSYLSYSALYTHTKTKHNLYPISSEKCRGRPKKGAPRSVRISFLI